MSGYQIPAIPKRWITSFIPNKANETKQYALIIKQHAVSRPKLIFFINTKPT